MFRRYLVVLCVVFICNAFCNGSESLIKAISQQKPNRECFINYADSNSMIIGKADRYALIRSSYEYSIFLKLQSDSIGIYIRTKPDAKICLGKEEHYKYYQIGEKIEEFKMLLESVKDASRIENIRNNSRIVLDECEYSYAYTQVYIDSIYLYDLPCITRNKYAKEVVNKTCDFISMISNDNIENKEMIKRLIEDLKTVIDKR